MIHFLFVWHDCIGCYLTFFLLSIEIQVVGRVHLTFVSVATCRVWLVLTIILLEQPICQGNQKLFKKLVFLELFAQVILLFSHIWNFLGKCRGDGFILCSINLSKLPYFESQITIIIGDLLSFFFSKMQYYF